MTNVDLGVNASAARPAAYGWLLYGGRIYQFPSDMKVITALKDLQSRGVISFNKVAISIKKSLNGGSSWAETSDNVDSEKTFAQLGVAFAQGYVEKAVGVDEMAKGA